MAFGEDASPLSDQKYTTTKSCISLGRMASAQAGDGRKVEDIAALRFGCVNGSCGQLEDGMRREARGQAPGAHRASNLLDLELAVEIHKVNGKAHEECVDRLAGSNPKTLAACETVAPEQAFAALGSAIGHFELRGEYGAAGAIGYLEAAIADAGSLEEGCPPIVLTSCAMGFMR